MTSVEKAFLITASFEGSGYAQVTPNFDGAGLSFGIIQWNFGTGTLHGLIKAMYKKNPQKFSQLCTVLVDSAPYNGKMVDLSKPLLEVCNMTSGAAVQWCKARHDGNGRLLSHWVNLFKNLGNDLEFQVIQRQFAGSYMNTAKKYMSTFGFKSERALALLYDICVQMGSVGNGSMNRYKATTTPSMNERDKLIKLAIAMGPQAGQWERDVRSRKDCIANGFGVVHGRKYDLSKQYGLGDGPATY